MRAATLDLTAYRAAVTDLIAALPSIGLSMTYSVRGQRTPAHRARSERERRPRAGVLRSHHWVSPRGPGEPFASANGAEPLVSATPWRAAEAALAALLEASEVIRLLAATPGGVDLAVEGLWAEMRAFVPNGRSSAVDLAALVRIYLLAQVEMVWWGAEAPLATDAAADRSPALIDLDPLARMGRLGFTYRRQAVGFPARFGRAVERRLAPGRSPRSAGLRFARTRPEVAAILNEIAAGLAERAPAGTPPLFVTSLARSVEYQQRLRALGYSAVLPSSHCTGYAADVEMAWFRRFGADRVLREILLERQAAGDVNVIDEGQAWHICLSPPAVARLQDQAEVSGRAGGSGGPGTAAASAAAGR